MENWKEKPSGLFNNVSYRYRLKLRLHPSSARHSIPSASLSLQSNTMLGFVLPHDKDDESSDSDSDSESSGSDSDSDSDSDSRDARGLTRQLKKQF